jgi:hypothetical protein
MRIKLIAATVAGALACATLGAAIATATSDTPDKARVAAPERGTVVANAPNARAAALVDDPGVFDRQKGFLKVTHPGTGNYCLKLKSTINEDTLVASVTPEWTYSPTVDVTAQWVSFHSSCPVKGNWVQVITLDDGIQANEAFSIVIP